MAKLRVFKVQVPVLDSGGLFKDYDLHKVGILLTRIKNMDVLSLNYYWLRQFATTAEYPPLLFLILLAHICLKSKKYAGIN